MASSSARFLDHTQQTNIVFSGGIRPPHPSRRAAVDLRFSPRGHWDQPLVGITGSNSSGDMDGCVLRVLCVVRQFSASVFSQRRPTEYGVC
jgi:hypothetical protein